MYIYNNISNILITLYAISDVYSLLSYARIKTFISTNLLNPHLTILSGDFISPIKYTNLDDGLSVMEVLDSVPIDLVSFGNHEFDIEPKKLNNSLIKNKKSTFISTNIANIANTYDYYIYSDNITGITIGFIGLCTNDFYQKYPIKFKSVKLVNLTINHIQQKYKPNFIIGLTHAELDLDIKYTKLFPQINLILGGHIHSHNCYNGVSIPILRTGENADSIYEIVILSDFKFEINLIDISNLQPDLDIVKIYQQKEKMFEQYNKEILFYFNSTFTNINPRKNQESLPQLICSLVTNYFSSKLTILNSGMFKLRGKTFHGNFTIGNFKELVYYNDYIVEICIDINDLVNGFNYSNTNYYDDGGYLQTDNLDIIYNQYKYNSSKCVRLSISTLVLDGINKNPFFFKYKLKNKYDGIPIHNIISTYKGQYF